MTAILEPPTATTGSPAPAPRPLPVPPPAPAAAAAPPVPPPPAPPEAPQLPPEPRLKRVLTPTGIRLLGVALVALFAVAYAVEPAPDGPAPVLTAAEELLATGTTFAMLAALGGFLLGRRWALPSALVFGGVMAVNVALCPATGHHQLAGWWFVQVAATAAMVALPALALLRTRAG